MGFFFLSSGAERHPDWFGTFSSVLLLAQKFTAGMIVLHIGKQFLVLTSYGVKEWSCLHKVGGWVDFDLPAAKLQIKKQVGFSLQCLYPLPMSIVPNHCGRKAPSLTSGGL